MTVPVQPPAGARRPRALLVAYACEPGRGSEPGAGWGVVRAAAEVADCTVLVAPEHGPGLARWRREAGPEPTLRFVEVPDTRRLPPPHRRGRIVHFVAYLLWLRRAVRAARALHVAEPFDLVHHVTYSAYWLPSPIGALGPPVVWGPVGGAVVTPLALWPTLGARGVVGEVVDLVAVRALARLPATRRTWRRAAVCLAQNEATRDRLPAALRARTTVLNHALFTELPEAAGVRGAAPATRPAGDRGVVLFVGALEARKGARLALRALADAVDVRLVVVGDGPERPALERLAGRLGVAERVTFLGRVPRERVVALAGAADAVVFTGLREEGGLALAESLLTGAPTIVLAHGGAGTIARAATDPTRVAVVAPAGARDTARRLGDAMTRLSRAGGVRGGALIDRAAAGRALRAAYAHALAVGVRADRARADRVRAGARGAVSE